MMSPFTYLLLLVLSFTLLSFSSAVSLTGDPGRAERSLIMSLWLVWGCAVGLMPLWM